MISDEELSKYINESFSEEILRRYEDQLLCIFKYRQETYPSEKHDQEWLAFTNFVCERRYKENK